MACLFPPQFDKAELSIELIGCLVEAIADDENRIDQKCFEKIFNSCVKALLITMKVDSIIKSSLQAFCNVSDVFLTKFTEELMKRSKNSFPLVRMFYLFCTIQRIHKPTAWNLCCRLPKACFAFSVSLLCYVSFSVKYNANLKEDFPIQISLQNTVLVN